MKRLTAILLVLVVVLASAAGYLGYRLATEPARSEVLVGINPGEAAVLSELAPILAFTSDSVPAEVPGTVTDDSGREVTIGATPQMIVSLAPSITEILFALGSGDQVVGVSNQCDYPEEAKTKAKVGDYWDPSVEQIVALGPDLVLTETYKPGLVAQLEGVGLIVVVIQPGDIVGIFKSITLVGKIAGKEAEADELVAGMKNRIISVAIKVVAVAKPGVFYEGDCTYGIWTTGTGTFQDSLITLAGGRNIAATKSDFYEIGSESLIALNEDIDVIIWGDMGGVTPDDVKDQLPWSELTAMQAGKVYVIDPDLPNRPGPRIVDALEEFARIIHPELF